MAETNSNILNKETLLTSLNDGVYAVDKDRKIFYWSPAAETITGWRSEDILGKTCYDDVLCHVDKDGRQLCGHEHCPLHRAMVTNKGSDLPIILYAKSKKGPRVPMRVSVAPIRNAKGEAIGGIETFRDATNESRDMELTRRIQSAMLRKEEFQDKRMAFSTYYLPWGMIGGDYYAMERVGENCFAFMLSDVSGHGVAAALYTVYMNMLWQNHSNLLTRPAELAKSISEKLSVIIGEEARFATAIFGMIDLAKMEATLAYAGGPAPLLFHEDGTCDILNGSGTPLGFPIDAEFDERTVSIRPGDCLLTYSDGVLEICGANGEELGVEGLVKMLKEVGYPKSKDFSAVEERLLVFSDRIRFSDDLTFLEARLA